MIGLPPSPSLPLPPPFSSYALSPLPYRNVSRDDVTARQMIEKANQAEAELARLQSEESELELRLDIRRDTSKKHSKKLF